MTNLPDRNADKRAFIAGLRELADWLVEHPDVPAPPYPNILLDVDADNDEDGAAQVQAIAAEMGVEMYPPGTPSEGQRHYLAGRKFGLLGYRVYYIPQARREQIADGAQ